jgi:hypothetical protein
MDNPEKLATLDPQDTRRRQTKQKTQHSTICVGHHYTQANTNIVCPHVLFHLAIVFFFLSALLWFTDSDYPFGIFKVFLLLRYEVSYTQFRVRTNRTSFVCANTKKNLNRWATRTAQKTLEWTQVVAKGKQFLFLIRHPPSYSYIPSRPVRRVWRYQKGNQNPYIEEEQTTQWPKGKVQKGKQRSTKHTYKTKDRATRTPLKTVVNSNAPEGLKWWQWKGKETIYIKSKRSIIIWETDTS